MGSENKGKNADKLSTYYLGSVIDIVRRENLGLTMPSKS